MYIIFFIFVIFVIVSLIKENKLNIPLNQNNNKKSLEKDCADRKCAELDE
jgi:hypothetical protein